MKKIWIDLANPSHPLFFKPVIRDLSTGNDIFVTMRHRGETVKLAKQLNIDGKSLGSDYENPFRKSMSIMTRTLHLMISLPKFEIGLSFENFMSVVVSKMRLKKSILLLDNDLKYKINGNFMQDIESNLKTKANYIIVPKACEEIFSSHMKKSKLISYDGFKEDIYIADFVPDPMFKEKIPFDKYYVIRPEALASFYVKEKESIVPELLNNFSKEDINIVLLPRDKSERQLIMKKKNIHVPSEPLNGLDLIYNSSGVLTGSGTMAREAAVMGIKAVSFFPSGQLLSVDQDLIEKKRMIHSRDPNEIIDYITNPSIKMNERDSKPAQAHVINLLREIINEK
jgi:uncharacterized protein